METKMLLPNRYKTIGWCLALPSFIIIMLYLYFDFAFPFLDYSSGKTDNLFRGETLFNLNNTNFTDEIFGILLITGLLMVAFSREKMEDERTMQLRLESLLWAVLINSILVMLAIILIYGSVFLQVMVYNMCTTLIIFIARFNYVMYREKKRLNKEREL
ncbi:MAG TPA: hypothetical protein VG738_04595 [Chitinophagaceae bacterium]|nr:hypothetical protein [Chitinophagaceae bacterium]